MTPPGTTWPTPHPSQPDASARDHTRSQRIQLRRRAVDQPQDFGA
ncbi:DUF1589 domain-containing protein [Rhodopirellula baltica]